MKVKFIIIIILITIINMMFFNINIVQADTSGVGQVIKGGDDFLEAGKSENNLIDEEKLQNTSKTIYNILLLKIGRASCRERV